MVPKLNIDKLQPGKYLCSLTNGGQAITTEVVCTSIAEAIAHFGGDVPEDWAMFVEIRYSGFCLGTISTARMVSESHQIASELVSLCAEVYRAEDTMSFEKKSVTVDSTLLT